MSASKHSGDHRSRIGVSAQGHVSRRLSRCFTCPSVRALRSSVADVDGECGRLTIVRRECDGSKGDDRHAGARPTAEAGRPGHADAIAVRVLARSSVASTFGSARLVWPLASPQSRMAHESRLSSGSTLSLAPRPQPGAGRLVVGGEDLSLCCRRLVREGPRDRACGLVEAPPIRCFQAPGSMRFS